MLVLHCCIGFSLVAASRDSSLVSVHGFSLQWPFSWWSTGSGALGHLDFSSCNSWALKHSLNNLWCMGLAALWHVESSRTRDQTHVPVLADRFLITMLPGKSVFFLLVLFLSSPSFLPLLLSLLPSPPSLFFFHLPDSHSQKLYIRYWARGPWGNC